MDFDAYERELWAGRAADYARGFARLTAHTVGMLLDAAGVTAGMKLLDVGTGPGVVAGPATERGARVTAVDAEPGMVETAVRNVPGLDVRVAILPELSLPDGEWWEVPLSGVGSSGVVLGRQDAATVARIKKEFDRLVAPYAAGDGQIALPAVAVLASGTR